MLFVFRGHTQQLIKEVDDLFPGLCSLLARKFREVGSSVVNIQAVDALQHNGYHSLGKDQHPQSLSSALVVVVRHFIPL